MQVRRLPLIEASRVSLFDHLAKRCFSVRLGACNGYTKTLKTHMFHPQATSSVHTTPWSLFTLQTEQYCGGERGSRISFPHPFGLRWQCWWKYSSLKTHEPSECYGRVHSLRRTSPGVEHLWMCFLRWTLNFFRVELETWLLLLFLVALDLQDRHSRLSHHLSIVFEFKLSVIVCLRIVQNTWAQDTCYCTFATSVFPVSATRDASVWPCVLIAEEPEIPSNTRLIIFLLFIYGMGFMIRLCAKKMTRHALWRRQLLQRQLQQIGQPDHPKRE